MITKKVWNKYKKINQSLEAAAYHEAGHVVAGYLCGVGYAKVTIKHDGTHLGASHRLPMKITSKKSCRDLLRIYCAGAITEMLFFNTPALLTGSDYDHALYITTYFTKSDNTKINNDYLVEFMGKTKKWIKTKKILPMIAAVGSNLLERKTLSQVEIEEILRNNIVN